MTNNGTERKVMKKIRVQRAITDAIELLRSCQKYVPFSEEKESPKYIQFEKVIDELHEVYP